MESVSQNSCMSETRIELSREVSISGEQPTLSLSKVGFLFWRNELNLFTHSDN